MMRTDGIGEKGNKFVKFALIFTFCFVVLGCFCGYMNSRKERQVKKQPSQFLAQEAWDNTQKLNRFMIYGKDKYGRDELQTTMELSDRGVKTLIIGLAKEGYICKEYGHHWTGGLEETFQFRKNHNLQGTDWCEVRKCKLCSRVEVKSNIWNEYNKQESK